MTAQEVCKKLQQIHKIQYDIIFPNGKDAGQSINHIHLHLIPKTRPIECIERK